MHFRRTLAGVSMQFEMRQERWRVTLWPPRIQGLWRRVVSAERWFKDQAHFSNSMHMRLGRCHHIHQPRLRASRVRRTLKSRSPQPYVRVACGRPSAANARAHEIPALLVIRVFFCHGMPCRIRLDAVNTHMHTRLGHYAR